MHWLAQSSAAPPAQSSMAASLFEDDSALILHPKRSKLPKGELPGQISLLKSPSRLPSAQLHAAEVPPDYKSRSADTAPCTRSNTRHATSERGSWQVDPSISSHAEHAALQSRIIENAPNASSSTAYQHRQQAPPATAGWQAQGLKPPVPFQQPTTAALAKYQAQNLACASAQTPSAGMDALSSASVSFGTGGSASTVLSHRDSHEAGWHSLTAGAIGISADIRVSSGRIQATPSLAYFHNRPWRVQTPSSVASSTGMSAPSSREARSSGHHAATGRGTAIDRPAHSTADGTTTAAAGPGMSGPMNSRLNHAAEHQGAKGRSQGCTVEPAYAMMQHDGGSAAASSLFRSHQTAGAPNTSKLEDGVKGRPQASLTGPMDHGQYQASKQALWGSFKALLAGEHSVTGVPAEQENIPPNLRDESSHAMPGETASADEAKSLAVPLHCLLQQLAKVQQQKIGQVPAQSTIRVGIPRNQTGGTATAPPKICSRSTQGSADRAPAPLPHIACQPPPDDSAIVPRHGMGKAGAGYASMQMGSTAAAGSRSKAAASMSTQPKQGFVSARTAVNADCDEEQAAHCSSDIAAQSGPGGEQRPVSSSSSSSNFKCAQSQSGWEGSDSNFNDALMQPQVTNGKAHKDAAHALQGAHCQAEDTQPPAQGSGKDSDASDLPGSDADSDCSGQSHNKQPHLAANGLINSTSSAGAASETTPPAEAAAAVTFARQNNATTAIATAKGVFEGMQCVLDPSIVPAEAERSASCFPCMA